MSFPCLTCTPKDQDILKRSDFFSDQALHRSSLHHFTGQAHEKNHAANSVACSGIGAQISEDERYGRIQRVDVGAFHAMGRVDARADERTADIVSGTQRRAHI